MKKVFTLIAFAFALLAARPQAQAQYGTALGVRFGYQYGLSLKHFTKGNMAIEGILSSRGFGNGYWGNRHFGWCLTGLAEWHNPLGKTAGLNWYIGGGAHIASWHRDTYRNRNWVGSSERYTVIGLDAIIGLEYAVPNAPIILALDWKPAFEFLGGYYFAGDGLALTLRFQLK